jgi:hypothetical protein
MIDPIKLTGGAPPPGSDEYKADIAAHAAWSQKLAEDLVTALNAHTKEHGSDIVANTTPLTPAEQQELAAMLAADESC